MHSYDKTLYTVPLFLSSWPCRLTYFFKKKSFWAMTFESKELKLSTASYVVVFLTILVQSDQYLLCYLITLWISIMFVYIILAFLLCPLIILLSNAGIFESLCLSVYQSAKLRIFHLFYAPAGKVRLGHLVIGSSIRPFVPPSVCLSVCLCVCP